MSGRQIEEYNVVCFRCHCSVHIDCNSRPICPRCGQTLEIRWRDPVDSSPRVNVTRHPGASKSLQTSAP